MGSYKCHRIGKRRAAAIATKGKTNSASVRVESKAAAAAALERPRAIKNSPMKSRRSRRCGQENKEEKKGRIHKQLNPKDQPNDKQAPGVRCSRGTNKNLSLIPFRYHGTIITSRSNTRKDFRMWKPTQVKGWSEATTKGRDANYDTSHSSLG